MLLQLGYGHPAAVQIDPIEKKPLNHFLPGTTILSLGTAGCNLGCRYCQNWDISKARTDQVSATSLEPEQVVALARRHGTPSIAFTYNEPTIWGEYVIDIAQLAHAQGINTVMVTNGYISRQAFFDIYRHIDAANVDLKAMSEDFYAKATLSHLAPVLDTLRWLRHETAVWLEVTNLVIPTLNDQEFELRRLCEWILENLGDETPVHFSAFHPDFKMLDKPATSAAALHRARALAMHMGLKFVYEGNIHSEGGSTICPGCKRSILRRSWHDVTSNQTRQGKCAHCATAIAGVFTAEQAEARRKFWAN
jgi:pyruvate formate lyase activating enzyme